MRQDPLPNWGGDAADAGGMFCRSITTPAAEDSTSWAVLWSTHFPASFFTSVLCPESVSAIRFFGTLDGFKER